MNTIPVIGSQVVCLCGDLYVTPQYRGEFLLHWIRYPALGVSFLSGMEKL